MAAAFYQASYRNTSGDHITMRTLNVKRKSAVEILQETKPLFVKTEAVLDVEQRLVNAAKCKGGSSMREKSAKESCVNLAKVRKKVPLGHLRSRSDQLQTKLRHLLNGGSKENIAEPKQNRWLDDFSVDVSHSQIPCDEEPVAMETASFFSGFGGHYFNDNDETNIQYQSLPDLSTSSRESLVCTVQPTSSFDQRSDIVRRSDEDMTLSSCSNTSNNLSVDSSEKSYGKPPSLPKSLESMGGSFGKIEEKLNSWLQPQHEKIFRSRSFHGRNSSDESGKLPQHPSLPSSLNNFFQYLGLTSDQYNNLLPDRRSRSTSPIFFSSRGSIDSADLLATLRSQRSSSPSPPSPVSVVQTNARVVKWLVKTSQWL